MQVEIDQVEQYHFDGETLAKAEELGKPGLVTFKERQVTPTASRQPVSFACCPEVRHVLHINKFCLSTSQMQHCMPLEDGMSVAQAAP